MEENDDLDYPTIINSFVTVPLGGRYLIEATDYDGDTLGKPSPDDPSVF